MANENYITVKKASEIEYIEKKSRFIGHCTPVESEEEAIDFINKIRKKHYNATHNVYAYIIKDNNIMRFSDDGEPQGTAGVPVLEVLKKEGVTNVAVVVTRYFGGILLGAGGLVRAYGKAASLAVNESGIVKVKKYCIYSVKVDYPMHRKIEYEINMGGYMIDDTVYTDKVEMFVCVKKEEGDYFVNKITDSSSGKAGISFVGEKYIKVDI